MLFIVGVFAAVHCVQLISSLLSICLWYSSMFVVLIFMWNSLLLLFVQSFRRQNLLKNAVKQITTV